VLPVAPSTTNFTLPPLSRTPGALRLSVDVILHIRFR